MKLGDIFIIEDSDLIEKVNHVVLVTNSLQVVNALHNSESLSECFNLFQ